MNRKIALLKFGNWLDKKICLRVKWFKNKW